MKRSLALVLFACVTASAVATACTQRHRLGGRYGDDTTAEGGAGDTPDGSGAAPAAGGNGTTETGGSSNGGTGGASGSGGSAGMSGFAQQPDPGVLL